jgi:hypothetical protein
LRVPRAGSTSVIHRAARRSRELLERDVDYRARRLAEGGLARLFENLAPVVSLRGHELRVRQPATATMRTPLGEATLGRQASQAS